MSQPPGGFPPGYEWDEAKIQVNIRKHGIDFRDAVRAFDKPTLDRVDSRQDHGEVRVNSVGELGVPLVVNVTHTDRDGNTRLISARAATSLPVARAPALNAPSRSPARAAQTAP